MTPKQNATLGPWESDHLFNRIMSADTCDEMLTMFKADKFKSVDFISYVSRQRWAAVFNEDWNAAITFDPTFLSSEEDSLWYEKEGTLVMQPYTAHTVLATDVPCEAWKEMKLLEHVPVQRNAAASQSRKIVLPNNKAWKYLERWLEENANCLG